MAAPAIGVSLPSASARGEVPGDMAATARHAEELGFESVWVVDQLIAGAGTPILDSTIALAAAAAATTRVRLGFGLMILPLRPTIWVAKQVASLQHVSGDRVILGVGAGGDRHDRSWAAAGVPRRERGRRTDAALRVLPYLLAGTPVRLDEQPDSPTVQQAPGVSVPPILVGGMSDAAITRAVEFADGWFLLPVPPAMVANAKARLAEVAASRRRPAPAITISIVTTISGDPALPEQDALVRLLTDVNGPYGMPAEQVSTIVVTGGPAAIAARLSEYAEVGVQRVVVTLPAGDWRRQAELLADARTLLG